MLVIGESSVAKHDLPESGELVLGPLATLAQIEANGDVKKRWPALAAVLRARPVDITVVDPCVDGMADMDSVTAQIEAILEKVAPKEKVS